MINIITSSRYKVDRTQIRNQVIALLAKNSLPETESVNVVFVGKNKMRSIAGTYKNEDVALPVLSFLYREGGDAELFGEIVLCYPQVVLLAAERNKRVNDMIAFLIDHGFDNLIKELRA